MMLTAILLLSVQLSEPELITQNGEKEVFAPAFRGRWADTLSDCGVDGLSAFEVAETRIDTYEGDSVLLNSTPMIHETAPNGQPAYTIVGLVASRGETEVGLGKVRMSRVGAALYMSNAEAVQEEDHFKSDYANVRCPNR